MAIAEDIGYDAAGRKTGKNELTGIGSNSRILSADKSKQGSFFRLSPV
jgi:hypothetical protein